MWRLSSSDEPYCHCVCVSSDCVHCQWSSHHRRCNSFSYLKLLSITALLCMWLKWFLYYCCSKMICRRWAASNYRWFGKMLAIGTVRTFWRSKVTIVANWPVQFSTEINLAVRLWSMDWPSRTMEINSIAQQTNNKRCHHKNWNCGKSMELNDKSPNCLCPYSRYCVFD